MRNQLVQARRRTSVRLVVLVIARNGKEGTAAHVGSVLRT
jgi:hypothetical protein